MRLFVLLLMLLCSSAFGITVVQPSSGSSSGGGSPTVADQGSNNVYTGSNVFSNGLKTTQVELLDPSSLGTVFSNALTSAVTSNNGFYTDNNTLTWFNATNSTYTVKWSGGSLSGELGWTNSASLQAGEYFARIRCVTSRGPGTIAGLSLRIVSAAGAVLASNGSSNNPIGQIISCGYTGTQARGVDILVSGSLGQSYSLDFNDFYLTNSAVYDIASPGRVEVLAPNGMTASGVTLQSGTVNAAQGAFSTSLTLGGSNVMTSASGGGGGAGAFAYTGTNNINGTNGFNSMGLDSIRSFMGGGYSNVMQGIDASINGGQTNSIVNLAPRGHIGGGRHNSINTAPDAGIESGIRNGIGSSGTGAGIGGGIDNFANNLYAGIGNGNGNTNLANDAWIGGGWQNRIASGSGESTIGGGYANTIADGANSTDAATIGGGYENHIGDAGQTIAGGFSHDIGSAAYYSTVGGGYDNNIGASATYSFIGGGLNNDMSASTIKCVIGGGDDNNMLNGPVRCVIGGGENNQINGAISYETIGGGFRNQIQSSGGVASDYSTIGGGYTNRISGQKSGWSVIGGGYGNSITNDDTDAQGTTSCFIGGGGVNVIGSGYDSAILGGEAGRIDGRYSFILGGFQCQTRGTNSFACGYRAKATNVGAFAWSDSSSTNEFNSTRDNSFNIRAAGGIQWSPGGDGRTNVFLIPPIAFITNSTPSTIVAPCDGARVLDKGSNNLWIAYQAGVSTNWHLEGNLTVVAP